MKIILARHGNTFQAGEPVVWVGSQNDLPLVPSGVAQAERLGQALLEANVPLKAIYTGPLQRMISYAAVVLNTMNSTITPTMDIRLNEIDYGQWSGLTTKEVCERFGTEAYEAWEKHSIWPQAAGWTESAELVAARIRSIATELASTYGENDVVLIVASNGCLRYFLELIPGAKLAKTATGRIGIVEYHQGVWGLKSWDSDPIDFVCFLMARNFS